MLLLVGLGNPGEKYRRHRHNVGFMAVDAIADASGFGPPRAKFRGELREGAPARRGKALILKPTTYMNESGRSVGEAARFYKIPPSDVLVFHDELDLAPGIVRLKVGGGHAGHNGLRSIAAHMGSEFRRVRIGIGHPGEKARVTGHVLGDFSKADADWLEPLLDALAACVDRLADGDDAYQTAVAHRLAPPRRPDAKARDAARPTAAKRATPPTSDEKPLAAALRKLIGKDD
ncbi:MAG: aminoacyl-tRNA hydrolase [Parvularculaceae bacterium]